MSKLAVVFDEVKIDALFAGVNQCQLPGAAVGIAIGGRPVYRKGFGLASMELPVVLSPTIRMRIYSTTKHFTCLVYLLLCEEGRAGIDDPLGKYLPELHPVTRQVTLRQLMGNIGGLRDAHDVCWAFSGMEPPVSSADLLSLYRTMDDVNFPPGTAWHYSNGGFLLVEAVIERITGNTLERLMWERIFEPVGMYDTLLRRLDTDFVANSATMHMTKQGGGFDRSYEGTTLDGSGGVVSTVDDMLRWLAHMDAPTVGSESTWTAMKTSQTLANGRPTGYGLGLFTTLYRGIETIHHAGGGLGANAHMIKVPSADLDVAIMVNRHDVSGTELAYQVIDACIPDLDSRPEESTLSVATGTFRSPTTGRVIRLRGAASPSCHSRVRQIVSLNGVDLTCEPPNEEGVLGRTAFWGGYLRLVGDCRRPHSVQFCSQGNQDELLPVPAAVLTNADAFLGRYRSVTADAEVRIFLSDTGPQLEAKGRFGFMVYDLECLGERLWRAVAKPVRRGALRAVLSLDTDGHGLEFSTYSNSAISFRRCS